MPYDRKTELLWNYIGMAQFSEFSRIWGQGPAVIRGDAPSGDTPQTIVIRIDGSPDTGGGTPHVGASADSEIGSPGTSGSEGVSYPVTDSASNEGPLKIDIASFLPKSAGSHSSHADAPVSFGDVTIQSNHIRLDFHHSETTHSETTGANVLSLQADQAGLTVDDGPPKIYGPSDVTAHAEISGGDNTQTSTFAVEGNPDAAPTGWTNVGAEDIANVISQLTTASQNLDHGFIIDYVSGNLTSLFSIQQLNTLYDNDISRDGSYVSAPQGSLLGDINTAQSIVSGGNSNTNSATLHGAASLDNYDVLVVTGDLTEINKIIQVNLIVDDDVNQATSSADVNMPYGEATSVWDAAIHSGGNTQLNLAFIIDQNSGNVYLVGGHYGTTTSVTQTNILSDSDINDVLQLFHSQEGTGFLGFNVDGVITSGGDSQTNSATLVGDSDTSSAGGLPAGANHDLTSLLAFANLHPGDGDIHVLFVDGNYTIINLVVQINVIHDSDVNTITSDAQGAMGSLTDPTPPVVETPASDDGTTAAAGDGTDTTGSDHNGTTDAASSDQSHPADQASPDGTTTNTDTTATGTETVAEATPPAGTEGGSTPETTASGTDGTHGAPAETSNTPVDEAPGQENNTDDPLPVYANSGSLHYDQLIDSGNNSATNIATIINGGGPQVRIVEGHYYEYNTIDQINILMDSDHNHVVAAMNTDVPAGEAIVGNTTDTTHLTSADDVLNRMTG